MSTDTTPTIQLPKLIRQAHIAVTSLPAKHYSNTNFLWFNNFYPLNTAIL